MARSKVSDSSQTPRPTEGGKVPRQHLPAVSTSAGAVTKRRHRWRPGTKALREIKKYQKSTEHLIQKNPFSRLVREIVREQGGISRGPDDTVVAFRMQGTALEALQEAAEAYVVEFFENAQCGAIHARRQTVMPSDAGLSKFIARQVANAAQGRS